jgi:hypothetical protein
MSLINKALKKEQQRRSLHIKTPSLDIPTYESEPLTASEVARRNSKNPLGVLIGFTGIGFVMLVCGGAFVYFGKSYLSNLSPPSVVARAESDEASPTSLATGPSINPLSNALATSIKTVDSVEEVSTKNVDAILEDSHSLDAEPIATPEGTEPPLASEFPIVDLVAEKAAFKIEVLTAIEKFEVHGFRDAGANSRLLMSGRVFRLNDVVNHQLGIRFIGSREGQLIFKDSLDFEYTKSL